MFLQIQEPEHKAQVAIGIDLGTTHSLIAAYQNQSVTLFKQGDNALVPSVVHYKADGSIEVGEGAIEGLNSDPLNTIRSIKRWIGSTVSQEDTHYPLTRFQNQVAIETTQGPKTPIEVSKDILQSLYQRATQAVGSAIKGAVITVPAYFDDTQRTATKHAAQIAGIPLLRLINEPTAAAIAYGLEQKAKGLCLVFDLGGGTFDVTLLKIDNGVFHVLATGGDTLLGGDDIDTAIAHWLMSQEKGDMFHAMRLAKTAKEQLSSQESVAIEWQQKTVSFNRDTLKALAKPLVDKCLNLTTQVLEDAKIDIESLDDFILVGGSTKMPILQEQIEHHFGLKPLCSLDPEQVVVQGAAMHAAALVGQSAHKSLLIDVIPLSLGVETMGGMVEKILMRNSPIPAMAKQTFTTYENNQSGMIFHITQGERELAKDNRSLATFTLKKIPPMPKGHAKIEVSFQVDEQSLLHVTAKELTTGECADITVQPSSGLSDEMVTAMLKSALTCAEEDVRARALAQISMEAEQLHKAVAQALSQEKALVDPKQQTQIKQALLNLLEAIESESEESIRQGMEALESCSDAFMRERLDRTLKGIVQGQILNQMNEVLCRK